MRDESIHFYWSHWCYSGDYFQLVSIISNYLNRWTNTAIKHKLYVMFTRDLVWLFSCGGGVAALSSDIWRNVKSETCSSIQWERLISGGGGTGPMPVFYRVIKLNQRKLREIFRIWSDIWRCWEELEALSSHQHRILTRSPSDQHCTVTEIVWSTKTNTIIIKLQWKLPLMSTSCTLTELLGWWLLTCFDIYFLNKYQILKFLPPEGLDKDYICIMPIVVLKA